MITAITYSIISVLLLALIKELKPEFANLGGIYVTVILSRHVLEKITIFSDEMFKIL